VEEQPKENKAVIPAFNKGKTVKVRINPKRAITGVGKAGDVVEMDEATAKQYERDGFVTILK
jgi:hypothetical protein